MSLPTPLQTLGLERLPFPKAPKTDDLFRWPGLDELLARLRFAFACQGFALLTGEVGSGKSTTLRLFANGLDESRQPLLYFADSGLSPREFYCRVLEHFGVLPGMSRSRVRQQFQTLFQDLGRETAQVPRPRHRRGAGPLLRHGPGTALPAKLRRPRRIEPLHPHPLRPSRTTRHAPPQDLRGGRPAHLGPLPPRPALPR